MRFSALDWALLALSLAIALSAMGTLLLGGPAYVEDDGKITYTSDLHSSGSDDELTFQIPAMLFGGFALLVSWWPTNLRRGKAGIFATIWILQIPNSFMEVGTFSGTIWDANNWAAGLFVGVFLAAPILAASFAAIGKQHDS